MAKVNKKRSKFNGLRLLIAVSILSTVVLIYLDAKVRYELDDRQWQLPARVYSRALALTPGKKLSANDLQQQLQQLGYQFGSRWRRPAGAKRQGNRFWISSRGFKSPAGNVKPLRFIVEIKADQIVSLKTSGGEPLDRVLLEPMEIGSIYPRHKEDRLLVRLEQVPRSLVEILILIEDRDFYQHFGVSPKSIGRAFLVNLKAGRTVQGGSTITQQLVKNVFLSTQRSLWRKAREAVMAVLTEVHYSKDKILESYINEVYLGQEGPRGIHGFALASQHYFNRPLEELNAGQIALLVGLVKGPSYYDPWRNPERSKKRRNTVLKVMQEWDLITPEQQRSFSSQSLSLAKSNALESVYPAYLDLVRRQLYRDYSDNSLQTQGMKIYTAFDPIVQKHAESALAKVIAKHDKKLEAAIVVTDVISGDVVAVVGGRQMRYAGFNRALDAVRPVGSLIKPAVYLSALEQPSRYTLASMISDGPVEVAGQDGSVWKPRNFDRKSHGQVSFHHALAQSYNQATARLGMQVGLPDVVDTVQRLGITRELPELPSMLLGASALSPLEVAGMYQTIAASGVYSQLRSIVDIADNKGQLLARYPLQPEAMIDSAVMHLVHYAMLEVMREGTGKSAYQKLPADFAVAGKTGSTNDLRDSWFAGFSGDYLAVVWMGRDDNKSTGLTGSRGALVVWREFISRASHQPFDFNAPPGVAYHWVDSENGLLSREVCDKARYMPFIQGSAPTKRSKCNTSLPGLWQWFRKLF
jgi:penicillin-binding protein 1B